MSILIQHEDAYLDVAGGRYEWIMRMVRAAVVHPRPGAISTTDRIDSLATHPFWGLVLLIIMFGVIFWLTYSTAMPFVTWLDEVIITTLSQSADFALASSPDWFRSLIVDGLIAGGGAVISLLPVLVIFFAILGILEDVGYLARLAYIMDRFMHWIGLHGRSFLPLFISFGCNVPGILGARIIEERRAGLSDHHVSSAHTLHRTHGSHRLSGGSFLRKSGYPGDLGLSRREFGDLIPGGIG